MCWPVITDPVHMDVKRAARTRDRCQLTRYGSIDERIIADALIEFSEELGVLDG